MNQRLVFLLRISIFCLLFAKGIAIIFGSNSYHLISDSPDFLKTISAYGLITLGLISLLPIQWMRKFKIHFLFPIATVLFLISSYSKFVKVGCLPEQMIEHALQFFLPVFWMAVVQNADRINHKSWLYTLKIVLALTFIGHGIFAVGLNIVPQNFIDMTTVSLYLNEPQAISLLFVMGIWDFIVAILLFMPFRSIQKWSFFYMVAWGGITAFARMYWQIDQIGTTDFWLQNTPNTVYRLPNGLIPLFLFYALNFTSKSIKIDSLLLVLVFTFYNFIPVILTLTQSPHTQNALSDKIYVHANHKVGNPNSPFA